MIGSVHLADVGVRGRLAALTGPRPSARDGARYAAGVFAADLTDSFLPAPDLRRVGLIAFWDNEDALENFLAGHPLAGILAPGWHVRLAPIRASGAWPGLPTDLPRGHSPVPDNGPAAVLTLGRVRFGQLGRFLKASARAEGRLRDADGLVWATGLSRPPVVSTFSLWESSAALSDYAYRDGAHADALRADRAKPFHHRSAFVRFRPYFSAGQLDGRNPLAANWADALTRDG
ncbi:MAG TPA: hypothetical protein VJ914_30825 [Pseudonocardiaceae bacterium]|nr:hypothetical protein [Pseudonocardiaceae bacterium]